MSGEWSLSYLGGTLQGLALLSYGFAFAAIELYHDRGTDDRFAWAMLLLYPLAGITSRQQTLLNPKPLNSSKRAAARRQQQQPHATNTQALANTVSG